LLRQRIKAAGGVWRPREKLWQVTSEIVRWFGYVILYDRLNGRSVRRFPRMPIRG
jgi:hypothetical protein